MSLNRRALLVLVRCIEPGVAGLGVYAGDKRLRGWALAGDGLPGGGVDEVDEAAAAVFGVPVVN